MEVAKAVGLGDLTFFSKVGYGGGGSCATVAHLAAAVATGQATVGVAWRSRKRGSGPRPWKNTTVQLPTPAQWTRPFGLLRPADEIGMLARRYMHEYGATRDHLFNVALACRNRANQNPAAMMYERPLTREMYMTSRWISEPLCLFDNCLETDGALACVIVSAERAWTAGSAPCTSTPPPRVCPPSTTAWSTTGTTTRSQGPPGPPPDTCGNTPTSPRTTSTWPRSTTPSPPRPALPGGLRLLRTRRGRGLHGGRRPGDRGPAAPQHRRGRTQRGVRPRLQPHQRGREAVAGHEHRPGPRRRHLPGHGGGGRPHLRDPAEELRSRDDRAPSHPRPRRRRRALLGVRRPGRATDPGVRRLRRAALPAPSLLSPLPVLRQRVAADERTGPRLVVRRPAPAAAPGVRGRGPVQRDRRRNRRGPAHPPGRQPGHGAGRPARLLPPDRIRIGARVRVVFGGEGLPQWVLDGRS